jgi:hypothetical protein
VTPPENEFRHAEQQAQADQILASDDKQLATRRSAIGIDASVSHPSPAIEAPALCRGVSAPAPKW